MHTLPSIRHICALRASTFRSLGRLVLLWSLFTCSAAQAQVQPTSGDVASEDIEPRMIGTAGTTMIGLAGYVDKFVSPETSLPTNYAAHIDVGRFITRKFVISGGVVGTGSFGGDDSDELTTGSGAPALHVFGGLLYYFTPQSMISLYSGGEYWAQLTQRADEDAGSVVGKLGVQGVLSSRASLFIEGGYGMGLTRSEDGDVLSRFVGRIGIRLKF
jgi:hypothetical protein